MGPARLPEPPQALTPARGLDLVTRIVVIDGSTVRHMVRNGYPQAEAALLQLAAVIIDLTGLRRIPRGSIPRPSTIRSTEDCQTFHAVLPGRNVVRRGVPGDSPRTYFRFTIHEMLSGGKVDRDHETLLETMRAIAPSRRFRCPAEECLESLQSLTGIGHCPCARSESIFETDSLRLHERFEDFDSSAQAYTAAQQVVEQLAMVNIMRFFEKRGLWERVPHHGVRHGRAARDFRDARMAQEPCPDRGRSPARTSAGTWRARHPALRRGEER